MRTQIRNRRPVARGDWQEEYRRKLVTAEVAVGVIKPGDRIAIARGREPLALCLMLSARANELERISIFISDPTSDSILLTEDFNLSVNYVLPSLRSLVAEGKCDYRIGGITGPGAVGADVLFIELSPPDENGFCSFGNSVWNKKKEIRQAKIVLAEINKNLIHTYGNNIIHISEIDYFVEGLPAEDYAGEADLQGRIPSPPGEVEKNIAANVASLVKDGDCLEIGIGRMSESLAPLGILDGRKDIGLHTELIPRGIIELVKNGIINGKRKTNHQGKAVATAIGNVKTDLGYANNNAAVELYEAEYVLNPWVIAGNDNVLAINSALSVDLTGQIDAESVGPAVVGGAGGQLAFATGAALSNGGRFITVLPSTAKNGSVSRIVSRFASGAVVTVPRTLADIVVTEYGTALLKGKSQRERAIELINIAHPDFRRQLHKEIV